METSKLRRVSSQSGCCCVEAKSTSLFHSEIHSTFSQFKITFLRSILLYICLLNSCGGINGKKIRNSREQKNELYLWPYLLAISDFFFASSNTIMIHCFFVGLVLPSCSNRTRQWSRRISVTVFDQNTWSARQKIGTIRVGRGWLDFNLRSMFRIQMYGRNFPESRLPISLLVANVYHLSLGEMY